MTKYFFTDLSPISNKYLVRMDFEKLPLHYTEGNFTLIAARLLNISYANYLRLARDEFNGHILGRNHSYPNVQFDKESDAAALCKLLNERATECLEQSTFITKEFLENFLPCDVGFDEFEKLYPEGAYMIDIIKDKRTPIHLLQWGYEHLEITPAERAAYYERVKINNSYPVYLSYSVDNSQFVSYSNSVKNCFGVQHSKLINDSSYIVQSAAVTGSKSVKFSKDISNSSNIYNSQHVADSNYIVESATILESNSVYKSKDIISSSFVEFSENVEYSAFTTFCKNSKALLFCNNLDNAELCLFNKPISYTQYREILLTIREKWINNNLHLIDEDLCCTNGIWSGGIVQTDLKSHFIFPDAFYDWVATLPNYDPFILYNIIYLDKILLGGIDNG